ncbi:MAG TPA: protein kinase [Kofleriaceae bacterium]|nr:protein kinase [Kofleriaceae bacterium]
MTCPRCATTLEDGARFCGVCGHRLGPDEAAGGGKPGKPKATGAAAKKPSAIAVAPVAPPAADPYIGTTLNGRFTIEKKLGEGGFGAVYNGVQLLTGRRVAIKLLHPEMTRDTNVVARFRREGQVLCSLRDAHTITTYDFDQTTDGTLFIAMELLEGRSLHDVFHDEAPIAWQRMLKIIGEMCSSLEEAHSLGIVHRDLKPENIYLEPRPGNPEFVKILDFGIAKVMRGDGSSGIAGDMSPQLTATGQTLGTLEYMSPEQLMGKPLDGRSDIYALGVVTFEMLTGRLPFPDAVGPAALISAQLKKIPPSASVAYAKGGIPTVVDQLILRMLAKDKNQRFRDMSDLRREVDVILSTGGAAYAGRTPSASPVPTPEEAGLVTLDQRRPRTSSSPGPGPSMGSPGLQRAPAVAAPGIPFTDSAAVTARSGTPRPHGSAGMSAGPSPRRPGSEHGDPPWAGGRPYGSSDNEPARPQRPPPGPLGHHEPSLVGPGPAGTPPWMWITVAGILVLAIVIGVALAMR